MDIKTDGSVDLAHVKSSELKNPQIETCVLAEFKKWTFPQPPENNEVTVTYPFYFKR